MSTININEIGTATASNKRIVDQCYVIQQQKHLLNAITAVLVGHTLAEPIRVETNKVDDAVDTAILSLILGINFSTNTILYLSSSTGNHTRDCYGIARTVFETAVNACFIIAKGTQVALQAEEHSRVKSIKDLKRESVIGESVLNFSYIKDADITIPPEIKSEMRKYETSKGREKPWTQLSVDQRILAIGKKYDMEVLKLLHMARFIIYRHSSEILHGSVFGCKYFLGLTDPAYKKSSPESISENIAVQHELILTSCIFSNTAVIDCFHYQYGFKSIFDCNKDLLKNQKEGNLKHDEFITPKILR